MYTITEETRKRILELCKQTEELIENDGMLGVPRSETDPINELAEEIRIELGGA